MSDKKTTTPKAPPGTTLEMLSAEHEADVKVKRIATIVAVVVHVAAFFITWPTISRANADADANKDKIFVVKQVKFKIPPKPEIPPPPKPKTKKVPIPDPTPDEPEPIREEQPEEELDFVPDDAFISAIPDAPPPKPTGPVRFVVGGDVTEPVKINAPNPVYPEPARRARIQGAVILELLINKQGSVERVKVLRGLPLGVTEAAKEAVRKWRFKPATRQGEPVDVIYVLTVNFRLQ